MNRNCINRALMRAPRSALELSLAAALLTACAAHHSAEDLLEVEARASAINMGQNASSFEQQYGLVATPGCSGTALSDRWIVSAAHCPAAVGNTVTFLGVPYTVTRVVRHPSFTNNKDWDHDVMLLEVGSPLLRPDGRGWAPEDGIRPQFYPDDARVIADNFVSVMCFGRSTGSYLFDAFTAVRGTSRHLIEVESDIPGVSLDHGDSGGGCFRFNGSGNPIFIATISQTYGLDGDGSTADGQVMAVTQDIADWIDNTI